MQAGVREACGADAEALTALINEAYGVEAFFVRGLRTDCADVLAHQRTGVFLVADEEGEIVGCVYLRCSSDLPTLASSRSTRSSRARDWVAS